MIRTRRLELRNATAAELAAELEGGRAALAAELSADVPDNWPPELYGEDAVRWTLGRMAAAPDAAPFMQYWFVLAESGVAPVLIGVGGFKGPPRDGAVELGYEILEQYRRRGYASEAVAGMLRFAFDRADVDEVRAETLPHLVASIGVLVKNGFEFAGPGSETGVIRYAIPRRAWLARSAATINLEEKLSLIREHWSPKLIGRVNDTDVKLVKLQGEFVWHHHEREDELFLVLEGRLLMQFRDRDEWLGPGELIVVPRGVEHRPVAAEEVHLLLIEPRGTLNTGNLVNERTVPVVEPI